ncbi:hypothetical protein BGZ73_004708 [Actinomortierella ambigua]|nr:hypothetical protein BGZ73_004708 [Actinomortierella ambigua]
MVCGTTVIGCRRDAGIDDDRASNCAPAIDDDEGSDMLGGEAHRGRPKDGAGDDCGDELGDTQVGLLAVTVDAGNWGDALMEHTIGRGAEDSHTVADAMDRAVVEDDVPMAIVDDGIVGESGNDDTAAVAVDAEGIVEVDTTAAAGEVEGNGEQGDA